MPLYKHEFLRADVPYHLGNNQYRTFTRDELRGLVANTKRFLAADQEWRPPLLSEHPPPGSKEGEPVAMAELMKRVEEPIDSQFADALRTAGWLDDIDFDEATGGANAWYDVRSKPYLQAIQDKAILFTSPEVRSSYVDGAGRDWKDCFVHFALTAKPRNPLQTSLAPVDGVKQFALQFSWDDARTMQDKPTLQFVGQSGAPRMKPLGQPKVKPTGEEEEEKPLKQAARGVIRPLGRQTTSAGQVGNMGLSGVQDRAGYGSPNRPQAPGMGPRTPKLPKVPRRPLAAAQGFSEEAYGKFAEQFDWPNVPPIAQPPPMSYAPAPGMQPDLGPPPMEENPDVIQAPDEALRGKSEAAVQLLDQVEISLPTDFDFTKLGDGIDVLLAALKTKIRAQQSADEAAQQQVEDRQLREEVPMAGQMSEEEGVEQFDRATEEYGGSEVSPRSSMGWQRKAYWNKRGGKLKRAKRAHAARVEASDDEEKYPKPKPPKVHSNLPRPKGGGKKESTAMSEDALSSKLDAIKDRSDKQARSGLRERVEHARIPPAIKKRLLAELPAVQFSDKGHIVPSLTVSKVLTILADAYPNGMQFGDGDLVEDANPPGYDTQQGTRERVGQHLDTNTQFDASQAVNEQEVLARYMNMGDDPSWSGILQPSTNGNH